MFEIRKMWKFFNKLQKKKTFINFVVIVTYCFLTFPVFSQETDAELIKVVTDMNRAYGFCKGQSFSLDRIQKEFPELDSSITISRLSWNSIFGKSCETVENKLSLIFADKWAAHKEKILTAGNKSISNTKISRDDAILFIETVKERAKGKIPSPMLETLLIFNPDFMENPVAEMSQGFKRTFRTENHPKSKGIDFQIEYPMSWTTKEGIRPSIIQNIKSDNGFGASSIMLMVKDIPLFNGRKLTNKEKTLMFAPSEVKNLVPDGATFISAKPIVLDAQKGAMLVYDEIVERVDLKMRVRSVQFLTIYDDKMIIINCLTGNVGEPLTKLNERYKKLEPLFKYVANSFVIQSQYK